MNAVRNIYFWMVLSFIVMGASNARADSVNYTLDNVTLDDNTQMTGTFSWTFTAGDFENGVGHFISLVTPWTSHNQDDLNAVFDIGTSIEITLEGSVHDDGVDITLFLSQPLTPTTASSIDLIRSKYEIGGNGFHDGLFLSGSITPVGVVGINPGTQFTFRLYANTPNPFRTATIIRYDLPRSANVDLRVFDVAGRLVRVLENSLKEPGRHESFWDGNDDAGVRTVAGVYFYLMKAGDLRESRKLIRLR